MSTPWVKKIYRTSARLGVILSVISVLLSAHGEHKLISPVLAAPSPTTFTYEDDFAYYIAQDTVWKKSDQLTFDKPVYIAGTETSVTLTIEPGAEVHLDGRWLTVYGGNIEANGTVDEPITFSAHDSKPFSLVFADERRDKRSWLNHVRIRNGGKYTDEAICASLTQRTAFFIQTAQAACFYDYAPAVYYAGGKVQIEKTDFVDNRFADIVALESAFTGSPEESFLEVMHSSLADNVEHIALLSEAGGTDYVRMFDNWYGTATKTLDTDPQEARFGSTQLLGYFTLTGWLTVDPFARCTENCYSNVLFLPGLEASRLYADGAEDNPLWEPKDDDEVEQLFMNSDGKSQNAGIYTKDVLSNAYVPIKGDIYKSFLDDIASWKTSGLIADYAAVPYDWRLSFDDLLSHGVKEGDQISYLKSGSYIIDELNRLAQTSKSGKVTIIAHSNGGLLTKALINKLGEEEAKKLVDKIVFVAVPQSGTPQAIGALLQGFDQGLPIDWLEWYLSRYTARLMANNMPSAYSLLPSDAYFRGQGSGVETPPITFQEGDASQIFVNKYGHEISSAEELKAFLSDSEGKIVPEKRDIYAPVTINKELLAYGEATHTALDDNWKLPDGIQLYQIAGTGEDTVRTIRYWTEKYCTIDPNFICSKGQLTYTPDTVRDGDGTVVAPSALAMSTDNLNVKRYWVDLKKYDTFYRVQRGHANILEVAQLREFIKNNILTQSSQDLPQYISDSEPPITTEKRLRFYLHSPLTLSARDTNGNEVSAHALDISGARYRRFGEVQYISLPADAHPTLVLDGQDVGSFTLEVQEVEGDTVTVATTFSGLPTSSATQVTMNFPDGTIEHASLLKVDYDGDGTDDISLEPKIGEMVVPEDTTTPVTISSKEGTQGNNGWYTGDVSVTLTAVDSSGDSILASGVEKTEYSLDNSVSWKVYAKPIQISQEGVSKILYTSTDKAGNKEEMKTLEVKIDKTAPEATITFNPTIQKLDIVGMDNLSQEVAVSMQETVSATPYLMRGWQSRSITEHPFGQLSEGKHKRTIETAILTDEAGHTTKIVFEKRKDQDHRIDIVLDSVSYDGVKTSVDDTMLQYRWNVQKKSKKYLMLAASAKTDTERVESHYRLQRDVTYIMTTPQELDDNDNDDGCESRLVRKVVVGMAIVRIDTEKGETKIVY